MNEFEILALVVLLESVPVSRQARREMLRHFSRIVKEVGHLFKGGIQ